ncbi:Cytochrome P450 [Rhynchospora pubera]|uniref:Cytochrome P450 n=1 Tax=Rhynchospora pubera TaxID=906938 RepID=A0AAV8F5N3_9POAL|nr:Cytochrome P450 [Rhynchospora pubera]
MLNLMEDESTDINLGRDSIKAIIMDTFGAGTESISVTMNWVMAELIRNPQVMKKLQEQIRSIAGSRSLIQEEDLTEMEYLKAVIKEALRLHPPGPLLVPRELIQDTTIKGYHIPCGALVQVNVWAIGRDPKIWDNPDDFRPERFLGSQVDYKGQDFELIPFGAGRRVCPGIGFAMPIVELAIANLLFKFDLSIEDSGKEEEMNMEEVFGLTMSKKTRLYAVATPHYAHA